MRMGLIERQLILWQTSYFSGFLLKMGSRSFSFIFTKKIEGLFSKFASREVLALSEGVSISVMMWSWWGDWMSLPFLRSMGTRWAVLFLFILRYLSGSSIFIKLACLRPNLLPEVCQSTTGCALAFLGEPRWVLLKGLAAVCDSLTSMGTQSASMFLLGSPGLFTRRSCSPARGLQCGRVRSGKHPIQCVINTNPHSSQQQIQQQGRSTRIHQNIGVLDIRVLPYRGGFELIGIQLLMIGEGSLVKGWAISTESKIREFVDEYLINYPQQNVRRSTQKLLGSLFRKGTESQRLNIIALLTQRVQMLDSMGRSSKEFLSLITNIFQHFQNDYAPEKELLFAAVVAKTKEIFNRTVTGKEYKFYSLCANMIDFGGEFKPYLLEANGCLKCFGKPELDFETTSLNSIRDELRTHLNSVEWILKRKYELNNLQINFGKKKVGYKTITIYAYEDGGVKRQLGKYSPTDVIPPFNLITTGIGITFQFAKVRRNHISCIVCSNSDEYSTVCSSCITKIVDMEAKVKVVAGNPDKINRELTDSFKNFNALRAQLERFAESVEQQSKANLMKGKIVQEMETAYLNIIQNLRLLRDVSEEEAVEERKKYDALGTDCYSCHFYEFNACIEFILNALKKSLFPVSPNAVGELISDFRAIFAKNTLHGYTLTLSFILAELFSKVQRVDYYEQIVLSYANSGIVSDLLLNLIQHIKREKKDDPSALLPLRGYIFDPEVNKHFSIHQKMHFFVLLVLSEEQFFYLSEADLDPEKLQDIKRLSLEQFGEYSSLVSFRVNDIFNCPISNVAKLFLVLLPEELIPESSLDIQDPGYLRYIRTVLPVINEEFILSNVVLSPNPIIKLNLFKLLPQIIEQLPLESSIELIRQLCQFRPLWNTYIRETIECFDRMLDSVEKERKLMLCLEGYAASKESLYFEHIYKILTPQRPNFIIRLEIPEKEMQKEEKNKGGPVEYIYLPVREVKSEDLKGDTIGALHSWITEEIRKMNQDMAFDLIVENNIVDNLELSLQIIYRKVVQKEAKRQIGSKTYDFFRVIYRIQGIFGEANERNCGNPRDEKLEECIEFSSYLINKLPNRRTGLDVLMDIIPTLDQKGDSRDRRDKIIRILDIIFRNETIIRKVVDWQYGNYILNLTVKFISLSKHDLKTTEVLLEMCSKIIDEANKEMIRIRKNSGIMGGRKSSEGDMEVEDGEESERAVRFILEKVKEAEEAGLKNISKKLIKILPFCSKDDVSSSKYLIEYFEISRILQLKYTQKLSWLLEFMQALSESYVSVKTLCREQGITAKIIEYIMVGFAVPQNQRSKEVIENIELCMTVLKGLIQGDLSLQDYLFEKGVIQEVYRVGAARSGVLSEEAKSRLGRIPSVCFEIIKYFQEGKMISQQVHDYFVQHEQQKRRAIQQQKNQRKMEILNKNKRTLETFQHLIKNEEVELLSCSSCKEGYSKKRDVLGVYLYSAKIEILTLDSWWKDNRKVQSVTSTSYFEPIHLECHNNAMRDDLKIQKTEWDGAIIRNSEVLCNNWCAFKGPDTTDEEFDKVYRKYFEKNTKANGFWIAINDLNGLLEKFSREFNFALETKGSSYTHNAKLIPVLMVLACHLMRNNQEAKYLREGVTAIEQHMTKKANLINLYFCLLLFQCTPQGMHSRRGFCLRLIDNLAYGHFKDSKPLYVYLALVQSIMKLTHKTLPEGTDIPQHLNAFIPKNFNSLLEGLEVLAEEYKNIYLKWENAEQARKHFEV